MRSPQRSPGPRHAARAVPAHAQESTAPAGSLWQRSQRAYEQDPDLELLARVRAGLLDLPVAGEPLPMLPPDPDPADTGEIPHAVGTWGKTAAELLDELAAEHLGNGAAA